jgi:hypothetical protein
MLSEHVLAAAANAVKKSIKPFTSAAAGEISGMIGDQLRYQRWKNATKILERAKRFCVQNKIPVKALPIKFIVPFLDSASLEEASTTTTLSDLWASLLASSVRKVDAKSHLFIDKLRALSTEDAKQLSKLVRFLLKEKNANINQFRDSTFDPDSWNIDMFEEFRFHVDQHLAETIFKFVSHKNHSYSITPEPEAFLKRYLRKWPSRRDDFFVDHYAWQIFNAEGFYGGASNSDIGKSKQLSLDTIDTLVALGFIERQVQVFRVRLHQDNQLELRFDIRLCALTTLGFQFLRATHINDFGDRTV